MKVEGLKAKKREERQLEWRVMQKKKNFEGLNSKIKRKVIRAEGNTKKKGGEGEGSKEKRIRVEGNAKEKETKLEGVKKKKK